MTSRLYILLLPFTVMLALGQLTGCYTQVGTSRSDKYSGEYPQKEEVQQEEYTVNDSDGTGRDYYFDENGYPRDRYYLGYYSPSWVVIGAGWYDPWYWPFSYSPFWCCWNMYPAWYGWSRPWYHYYYYPPYKYPTYAGGGHGSTRTVGSTRGTVGGGRGRDVVEPGRISDPQLPTGLRGMGSSGRSQDATTPPTSSGRKGVDSGRSTGTRETPAVRGGTSRGGSGSGTTRAAPRRPSRGAEQSPPPRQGGSTDTGQRGGNSDGDRETGGRSVSPSPPSPSAPASTPPSSGGGRQPGENRGGGGNPR